MGHHDERMTTDGTGPRAASTTIEDKTHPPLALFLLGRWVVLMVFGVKGRRTISGWVSALGLSRSRVVRSTLRIIGVGAGGLRRTVTAAALTAATRAAAGSVSLGHLDDHCEDSGASPCQRWCLCTCRRQAKRRRLLPFSEMKKLSAKSLECREGGRYEVC